LFEWVREKLKRAGSRLADTLTIPAPINGAGFDENDTKINAPPAYPGGWGYGVAKVPPFVWKLWLSDNPQHRLGRSVPAYVGFGVYARDLERLCQSKN
jgi:hypothetical protein